MQNQLQTLLRKTVRSYVLGEQIGSYYVGHLNLQQPGGLFEFPQRN